MALLETPEGLVRLTEANYSDDIGELADGIDPVDISRLLFDQDGAIHNSSDLSTLFTTWGQFLDHDLSLTPETHDEVMTADGLVAPIGRSEYLDGTGQDDARLPVNAITWQIDGSQIYGSTADRLEDVRAFEGGRLSMSTDATSDHDLLPHADPTTFMAGDISSDNPVFLAGDIRANENPNLLSLQTMMARNHNYWADKLAEAHPDWDDQQLFDGARQIVEFEIQKITYEEWLPHLVGDAVPDDYTYDPDTNGQISVEFSTAAFRFGHTMVSSSMDSLNDDGTDTQDDPLTLMESFFNHDIVEDGGIDALIRGMLDATAQELDTKVVDDLNFFLSTPTGVSGFSLVAINLLRGQDHGLQSYVDTRAALLGDIDPATIDPTDFSILSDDPAYQAELAAVFPTVHDIPLWVGGLAEDAIDGTQLGPLFTHIVADQFIRTREADESFGALDPALGNDILSEVLNASLSDLIERTTDVDMVQDDPFVAAERDLVESEMPETIWGVDDIDLTAQSLHGTLRTANGDDSVDISGGTHLEGDLKTGQGHDTIEMSSGWITGDVLTGTGHDTVNLSGTATIGEDLHTGSGEDSVTLSDMAVVHGQLSTNENDDTVSLSGRATIEGGLKTGRGDDTVSLGARTTVEDVFLGAGDDEINVEAGANVSKINGGHGQDSLKITGPHRIEWTGDGDGIVHYQDADGTDTGESFRFTAFESVTCFTPGTRIISQTGMVAIETLGVGDKVWTMDAGLQPIGWIGRTTVPAQGDLAPIRIAKGALGNARDLFVSPQHRMLLEGWKVTLHCAEDEVLAPARGLVNDATIRPVEGGLVTYIHIAFDSHQIVIAEGIPSESFYPGACALSALDQGARDELLRLFPDLNADQGVAIPTARQTLSVREAQVVSAG